MSYPILVIDTNKVIAAALKPGRIRTLIYQAPLTLIAPIRMIEEAHKHSNILAKKAGVSRETLLTLLQKLVSDRINLETPRKTSATQARKIASRFDPDDWPFIALALQHRAPLLTNDKDMLRNALKTGEFKAVDTRGVEMLLEGRSWHEVEEEMRKRYL